jgi:hypothetical protein
MKYIYAVDIVLCAGIFFLLHFYYLFILSRKTKKWASVEGEILNSKLEFSDIGEEATYKAKVGYQYVVEGKKYFSERVFYGDYIGKNLSYGPKSIVKKYSKEGKVSVYYNIKHPSSSVLETGINSVIYRELFIGILFLALSVFMVVKESFFLSVFE